MGTEITLEIAGMTVSWSKNSMGVDHGMLFQHKEIKRIRSGQINYEYFEEEKEDPASMEMGFSRKLKDLLPRLELLGFTLRQAELEYTRAVKIFQEEDADQYHDDGEIVTSNDIMSFKEFCAFVTAHPIARLDDTYDQEKDDEQRKGRFSGDVSEQRLPHHAWYDKSFYSERSYFGSLLGFLHPYSILRVLAENAQNGEADVVWQYGPLVENGWAKETEFLPCPQPQVIWMNYKKDYNIYHGALENKERYVKAFFRQTAQSIAEEKYNAEKILAVLNALVAECTSIAEGSLTDKAIPDS